MIDGLLITVGFSFILSYNIKMIRKEMQESGKTLWQVLKSNQKNYKGAPHLHTIPTSIVPYDFDSGITSSKLASDPAFYTLYGNMSHRR